MWYEQRQIKLQKYENRTHACLFHSHTSYTVLLFPIPQSGWADGCVVLPAEGIAEPEGRWAIFIYLTTIPV